MHYMLYIQVFCLLLCVSKGVHGFQIFRSAQDIFTNLNCAGENCSPQSQCQTHDAECVSDNCTYCRCFEGKNTFIINKDGHGECKSDDAIVPASVPSKGFWLQNHILSKCLKLENDKIIGVTCSSRTLDMLWIWTNTTKRLLMNVKTLECMQRTSWQGGMVFMEPCQVTSYWQRMGCIIQRDRDQYLMKIDWKLVGDPFLHLDNRSNYVINKPDGNQLWNSSEERLCGSNITYAGCYRFSDGSFMKFVNYSERNTKLDIAAPIFRENDQNCTVGQNFEFLRESQEWEVAVRHFSVSVKSIKIDTRLIRELEFSSSTMEHFKAWNGSVVKLSVACGNEEHCVLLKLASLPTYSDVFSTSPSPSPVIVNTTRGATQSDEITHYIAVAVVASLLLVGMAMGYLIYYKRRNRTQVNNAYENGVLKFSENIYEDPDLLYETSKVEAQIPLSEMETDTERYCYPDTNGTANPALTDHECSTLKEKKHDVLGNQPGTPADDYILPETNRGTKPVVIKYVTTEEGHKLPSNQSGTSSDTCICVDHNGIRSTNLTECKKPWEDEHGEMNNLASETSTSPYIYPEANRRTKPAVINEYEMPRKGHQELGNVEPWSGTNSDRCNDSDTIKNTKSAVINEDDRPKEEGHDVLDSVEPGTNSDTRGNTKVVLKNEEEMPKKEGYNTEAGKNSGKYHDTNRNTKPAVIDEYKKPMKEGHDGQGSVETGATSENYNHQETNGITKTVVNKHEEQPGTVSDTYIHPADRNNVAKAGSS